MLKGQITSIPTVAVLDFEARGIAEYEAGTLTERLRSEITRTHAVRLIERKMLDKIMAEQGLQQSGCTTAECAVEVGQLLGAQYMISGAIGRLGGSYTVDAKMFSVSTGVAESSKSISFEGKIEGLLLEMEIMAWEIVGLVPPHRLLIQRKGGDALDKITVAVLDFEARGISMLEAQTLTDRFSTEISNTKAVLLIQRQDMNEILEEQGFETQGCTSDECAAEVGALLGVQYTVTGAIGRVGNTYTIDATMFDVSTGAAYKTESKTYSGAVDELITEIEILAWEIMGIDPPQELINKSRDLRLQVKQPIEIKPKTRFGALLRSTFIPGFGQFYSDRSTSGWIWIGSEIAAGALAYMQFSKYQTAFDDFDRLDEEYKAARDPAITISLRLEAESKRTDMISARDQTTMLIYVVAGIWATNMVHAFLTGPKYASGDSNASIELDINKELKHPELRLSFVLGK